MIKLAPSILSADFSRLGDEIDMLERSSCDLIHVDVMDGHFVPNITIGPMVINAVRNRTKKPFDVHLMMDNPMSLVDLYIDAGADIITLHPEVIHHLHRAVYHIKSRNVSVGIALNPSTPLEVLNYIIKDIDMILVMTVNPGFGGQEFIPSMLDKIKALKNKTVELDLNIDIEVDGGIHSGNIEEIVRAGANVIVAGSAIFNSPDPSAIIDDMRMKAKDEFMRVFG
jgi:ribulose-phosphate 3-epimerase